MDLWEKLNAKGHGLAHELLGDDPEMAEVIPDLETTPKKPSLSDRLLEQALEMALPSTLRAELLTAKLRVRASRPGLSVPVSGRNFRAMTSRMGVIYDCYYWVLALVHWENPAHVLSVLAIYSFVCLNPRLLLALPFLCASVAMAAAYAQRHGAKDELATDLAPGPPLRPPDPPKPVPEWSREFALNIVDTQNAMADYVVIYDALARVIEQFGCFIGDETRSLLVYVGLLGSATAIYLWSPLLFHLPWRQLCLGLGWLVVGASYPAHGSYSKVRDRLGRRVMAASESYLLRPLDALAVQEFGILDAHEQREVEVFEAQRFDAAASAWSSSHFHSAFELAPALQGASVLATVLPPPGWVFVSEWQQDMRVRWVAGRGLQHLVQVDSDEKWVYTGNRMWRQRRWVRVCARSQS